jgi:RNA polymerase sigma factor (sigma-70 family)
MLAPRPEPTDDELMSAYAGGDTAAFEVLYARHQAALYRFVRRLLGTALAAQVDEAFQDTWLRVVHARAQWQPQGAAFRTWLFTLAHHRVIDLWRRSGREVPLETEAAGRPGLATLAGARRRHRARRGRGVLAARRRAPAAMPRGAAAGAAQRLPAAP